MLTPKEERMLRKYYSRAATSLAFFLASLLSLVPWVLSIMIGDIVFESPVSNDLSIYSLLIILVLYMGIFIYQVFSVILGLRGKKWAAVVEKARVAVAQKDYSSQASAVIALNALGSLMNFSRNEKVRDAGDAAKIAGGIVGSVMIFGMMSEARANIKKVADALEIRLPSAKRQVLVIAILPLLLIIGTSIPHYIQAAAYTNNARRVAYSAVGEVAKSFQDVCGYVHYDDPREDYRDYGYSVWGYVKDIGEDYNSYISVEIDNEGYVTEVSYQHEVDIALSKEENLDTAQSNFATLNAAFRQADVKVRSDNLLCEDLIREDFRELFEENTYYESLDLEYEDLRMYVDYYTEPEEEFDQYTDPRIYVYIRSIE